jgi:hypothetical protein
MIDRKQGIASHDHNNTPLHVALEYGAPKHIIERLLGYFSSRSGNKLREPISALFAPVNPWIHCDVPTLQFLLDHGALVARTNLRVSMKSFFNAFARGRVEHVLLAFDHNYKREPNHLIGEPRDWDGTIWSCLDELEPPEVVLQFLMILLRYGAKPYDIVRSQRGMPDFFGYVEYLRRRKYVKLHESIELGVKLACVLQVLCSAARLPRFSGTSAPITRFPIDNIRYLKSFLDVTIDEFYFDPRFSCLPSQRPDDEDDEQRSDDEDEIYEKLTSSIR